MIRPVIILLALIALGLLGRLDRDGLLARAGVGARALGYEVRVEVKLQRAPAVPPACEPADARAAAAAVGRPACE
jgi:hypothetical protein